MASSRRTSLLPQIKIYGRPPPHYTDFTFTCQKKKKLFGDSYVKGVKGFWARTYRKGSVLGLTLELLRGMVHVHVLAS